jgi:hypothetical protein
MSARYPGQAPNLPAYRHQPVTGCLPGAPINQPDLRPWGRNPYYDQYAGARGSTFAGLGSNNDMNIQNENSEPIKDYANELDTLQVADDVQGNGMFDPFGSHGNINPDVGVFQDHLGIPGYLERERFYAPSEVTDGTTGQPVMYVPGGAVAIDQAQRQAFLNRNLWTLPPGVNPWEPNSLVQRETVEPNEETWAIGETPSNTGKAAKIFIISTIAGLSIGMVLALVMPRKA